MNDEIKKLIGQILGAAARLSSVTGRPCTPDGHLVGSIGEIYAQEYYGVKLYPPSHKGHDGTWKGREIQIKTTQKDSVELKGATDLLLVLKIHPGGGYEEIYNGDGQRPWVVLAKRKPTPTGHISISIRKLRELNKTVGEKDRVIKLK